MTKATHKKTLSVILFVAMLLNVLSCFAFTANAATNATGKWIGSTTAANGTVYNIDLTLAADGNYLLVTSYAMGDDTYHETENGTYTVTGNDIAFTGDKLVVEAMETTYSADNSSGTINGSSMTVTRYASFMAKSMGKAPVEIVLTKTEEPISYEDNLVSGTYELTEDSYDASAFMKMTADIIIDADAKTFELWRTMASGEYSKRSEGTIAFDAATGVYTINFTNPADKTTTFTYDAETKGVTFTSPLYFGAVAMNVTDDDGNFLPYTAYPKAEVVTYEDNLVSGTYELTKESYAPSAGMTMAADIIIDTDAKTFELWRTMAGGEYSKRSEGTIAFDKATGIYTINFTFPVDKTTTFTYDVETKGVTFTSPLYFGAVAMNVTDDDGNFLPYTAYPKAEAVTYEDNLVSGTYELTKESYAPSAGMTMAADIIIDTDSKTFELWRTMASGEYSKRSEGTIAFDAATGVYTINFTTPADKTTTFTYDAEAKGVTFTSPLYFGAVAMNVTDDDGNFLPYTAYPKANNPQPSDFKEGTYTGTSEKEAMSGVGIKYTISAAFADGKYSYDVRVQLTNGEYDNDDSTKSGTYIIDGDKLIFDGGNLVSAEITGEGKLKIYGTLSSFAFAPDYADIVWTSDEKPSENDPGKQDENITYSLTQGETGDYTLGSNKDYTIVCEGALADFVEVRVDGVKLDAANYTVSEGSTKVVISGNYLSTLSAGKHRIVFVYTNGTSKEAILRVAAAEGTYADNLKAGNYELKLDDFDDSVGVHRHPCIITIDTDGKTFIIHDTGDEVTNKGSGTFSFDSATGEYTMTYTAGGPETQADPTTTFVFKDNTLVFTSPLKIGRSMMNIRDNNGAFISYTAKLISDTPYTYKDELKSGQYELTEDSYDASAFMKVPAIITIDTANKTFKITDNRESTRGAEKGSGTYEFNPTTGVYTMIYTDGVAESRIGATATFIYADNAITFTSPMLFGSAMMNITDEDGNFIPYTAKLIGSGDDDNKGEDKPSTPNYVFMDGADGTVAEGAAAEYRLRCSGPLDKFVALYIDGELVDESNYTKSEGSTVITLSADYMKTLSEGQHTVRFEYTDGSAQTTLTVRNVSGGNNQGQNGNSGGTGNGGNGTNPQTGDDSNIALWIALMILSFAAIVGLTVYGKRRNIYSK